MLTSEIIAYGRSLCNLPSTNFFTNADALRAINGSWRDIYANLALEDDDFFVTSVTFTLSSLTAYPGRINSFTYPVPADFFRLRLVQFKQGDSWESYHKMTIDQFGQPLDQPSYIFKGTGLIISDNQPSHTVELWYYPNPVQLTLVPDFDLTYPGAVVPEILAYQVAMEILNRQGLPNTAIQARRNELFETFKTQTRRDDFQNLRVSNAFPSAGVWK